MILPEDVLVIPVAELSARDRGRVEAEEDDFVVTRRYARAPSKVLGRHAGGILGRFRTATPIARAVAEYSGAHGLDARKALREAFPALRSCMAARLLVPADSPASARIVPTLAPGDRVGSWEVVRCVHLLEDTEVYQAEDARGGSVALKMLRPGASDGARAALDREAAVLASLRGEGAPGLRQRTELEGRGLLVLEWCAGVAPTVIADEIRASAAPDRDARLLALGRSVLVTYVGLHERGVVHGDVHPGNILVDRHGVARLVDFGFARPVVVGEDEAEAGERIPRAGVAWYADPELAAARLDGRRPPPPSRDSERYSVAALLYRLLAGGHAREFPDVEEGAWRRIRDEPPLPFSRRGVPPWPAAERVLAKALAGDPGDRFASTEELLRAWEAIPPRPAPGAARRGGAAVDSLERFASGVWARVEVPGPLWSAGSDGTPLSSLALGTAGIAYALYRLACIRDSSPCLARSDLWLSRAEAGLDRSGAFYVESAGLGPDRLGRVSPYHTASGVHAVRALVSRAMGDRATAAGAVERFVAASAGGCDEQDLWLGRSGTLLTCALLWPAVAADGGRAGARALSALGDEAVDRLGDEVRAAGPLRAAALLPGHGMAHGWAGLLYATARWCAATGRALPAWVEPRLDELAACAEPWGRGVRWPWRDGTPSGERAHEYAAGWCAGSAGLIHLWTLAADLLDRPEFGELAELAGWHAWEAPRAAARLCCGDAGRAYALLHLYAWTGTTPWRDRATRLATRAVASREELAGGSEAAWAHGSLYRGELGLALLVSELATPEVACMPFFGDEGWPAAPGDGG